MLVCPLHGRRGAELQYWQCTQCVVVSRRHVDVYICCPLNWQHLCAQAASCTQMVVMPLAAVLIKVGSDEVKTTGTAVCKLHTRSRPLCPAPSMTKTMRKGSTYPHLNSEPLRPICIFRSGGTLEGSWRRSCMCGRY